MKAAIRRQYGSSEQITIESVAQPVPKLDEVCIRIHTTTVNRTDCANLTAKPFIMRFMLGLFQPKKVILGTDLAGEITALGENVTDFKLGDRVLCFNDIGLQSQANYCCAQTKNLWPIPANINYQEAAASLEGAHYAYSFIHRVNIKPRQKILINGAAGAIGSALLQFVKQYDVKITATCHTKDLAIVHTLGADKVFDYTTTDFTQHKSEKYDFIFDAVGKSTYGKCKPILSPKGIYISSELGPYAQNVFWPLRNFISNKKVIFPVPYPTQQSIPYIIDLLKKDKFHPLIDCNYAFEDIAQAYAYVLSGQKTGNVIITL